MAVKRIPCDIQSLISASARVNTFKSVIEELVYNSLDAESTSIAIRIHLQRSWIQVIDNGYGVHEKDFDIIGERYATSKFVDIDNLKSAPNKYGYRGQSLANIIEVSQSVKISSKSVNSQETWIKIFSHGKGRERHKVTARPSKGTTVEINGLLFNLNIQRKIINPFQELEDIKCFLEQLVLIHNNVSISLRDNANKEILFKIHKHRDIYQTFKSLFGIDKKDLEELQVEKNQYRVKAYIGMKGQETLQYQWIYLNNKFVGNTNIHDLVKEMFSKVRGLRSINCKMVKYNGEFNQTDKVQCQPIPFYFLFLRCPYFDYDVDFSTKQTVIGFKNWKQINKLIEKLIRLYHGELRLKELPNTTLSNHQKDVQIKKNSRDQVKKIMEKFLGKHDEKPKVTEVQKGVKGKKMIRRKRNKVLEISQKHALRCNTKKLNERGHNTEDVINVSLQAKKSTNNIKYKKKPNDITKKNKLIEKLGSKENLNNNYRNFTRHYRNIQLDNRKLTKAVTACKCKQKNDDNNIIQYFSNNIDTVKRRCNLLSNEVKSCLEYDDSENVKEPNIEVVKYSTTTNKLSSVDNRNNYCSLFKEKNVERAVSEIRSYDLLKTILKTQSQYTSDRKFVEECGSYKRDQRSGCNKFNHSPKQYVSKFYFDSHKYNAGKIEFKRNKPRKFISKDSEDNFVLDMNKMKESQKHKKGKIPKDPNKFKAKLSNKINQSHFSCNKFLNKYKNNLDPSILSNTHISSNETMELSKTYRNHITEEINLLTDTGDYSKNSSKTTYNHEINFDVNFNIESTYTIIVDSVQQSTHVFNEKLKETMLEQSYKNVKDVETYNSQTLINARSAGMTCGVDKRNSAFMSETQEHISNMKETIEPLKHCEVIHNNNENMEKVFQRNSMQNKSNRSLLNNWYNENINPEELQNCDFSQGTTLNQGMTTTFTDNVQNNKRTVVQEYTENKAIEFNKVTEHSTCNFKLNSRQRFVPKGMSPIFQKCFSKNICSYNLGRDYFEDCIYNNFANDVVIKSEIFQSKLQDVKVSATSHIEKATKRQKKNSTDLTFNSGSLKDAKVIRQIDRKFIAAIIRSKSTHVSSEFLVLFDQHAVHERIRLENNMSNYINNDNWKSVSIDAISMKMSKDKILYLHNHRDKFTQFGMEWDIINGNEILVNAVPEAIIGKHLRPTEVVVSAIKSLISEQIHAIKDLKGNVSLCPPSIMNLVFSEACRYAIKFGDQLSKRECSELITALANCKTPFQCAHGRPVMAVMIELKRDHYNYKVDVQKLKQFKDLTV